MDGFGEDGRSSYKVCRIASACEETSCGLRCQECCVCVHFYVCNCLNSLITSTICKHIHLVNRYLNGSSVLKDDPSQSPRPENSSWILNAKRHLVILHITTAPTR